MNLIRNNFGVSLIGVLMAAGILGIIAMGTSTLLVNMQKGSQSARLNLGLEQVRGDISGKITLPDICKESFLGINMLSALPFNVTEVRSGPALADILYDTLDGTPPDKTFEAGQLSISEMRLENFDNFASPDNVGTVDLVIIFDKGSNVLGGSLSPRVIKLSVNFDETGGTNLLTNCYTAQGGITPWIQSGADIYYSGGNVGIGTNTPATTLDVLGTLKVGNSGTLCNPANPGNEGALKYESGAMAYCGGSPLAWVSLNPSSEKMFSNCSYAVSPTTSYSDNQWHQTFCPSNKITFDFGIFARGPLDGPIRQTCCSLYGKAALSTSTYTSATSYTDDHQVHAISCSANQIVSGVSAYATGGLDGPVRVTCKQIEDITLTNCSYFGDTFNNPEKGYTSHRTNDTWHTAQCPPGQVLNGIGLRASGSYLGNIQNIRCCNVVNN